MRLLIAGSVLLAVLAFFLLVIPSMQIRHERADRNQAMMVSSIAEALARSGQYRVMVAHFYAAHGYFPSHIDEILQPAVGDSASFGSTARTADIQIANFGDVVMNIRDTDDVIIGTITLTAVDDEYGRSISWECHTSDFKSIQTHFPQCRYRATPR